MLRKVTAINPNYFRTSTLIPKPGFIRLIDTLPSVISSEQPLLLDAAVVQAARVSYGEGSKGYIRDKKLIDYLMKHKHTSPFEMVEFKFHVKLPIFVQRQWIRHRTASVNEISGRYTELDYDFYHPEKLRRQSIDNKQGSYENTNMCSSSMHIAELWNTCEIDINALVSNYHKLVKLGVAKEQARIILPQSMYTEFYWKIDLHNLLNFVKLRKHNTAQIEIRNYADEILNILEKLCPATTESWKKYNSDPPPEPPPVVPQTEPVFMQNVRKNAGLSG